MKIKIDKQRYGRYTKAQLRLLEKEALALNGKNESFKWLVLIGMYSGARMGEIKQLRTEDIIKDNESDILYFRITPEAGSVKTAAGKRKVPIHSHLIKLGLLEWISGCKTENIFNELQASASDKFRKFRSGAEIDCFDEDDNKLVFHSFRHSFVTITVAQGVEKEVVSMIAGHEVSQKNVTNNYIHQSDLTTIRDVVEKFNIN